jgi:hypothetical protein
MVSIILFIPVYIFKNSKQIKAKGIPEPITVRLDI